MEQRQENRAYRTSRLRTLKRGHEPDVRRELLLKLYDQTCTTWRALIDVRFKLLALVPTASLISLATVIGASSPGEPSAGRGRLLFSILGLIAVIGVRIYDIRNSGLHDELISRARKIEEELGISTGAFLGRPKPKNGITHDVATFLIYGAAIVAWLAAVLVSAGVVL
jgi:hypothetical protein